jgi:hypothetical protein
LQEPNDGNTAAALQLITKMGGGNLENTKNRVITEERKEDTINSELDLSKVSKELNE